jgi:hypothetical protein
MGGDKNVIENNRVEDHKYFGIILQPIPGLGPSPDPIPIAPTGNLYRANDNAVRNNRVSGSGLADLALGAPSGAGNCFSGNTFGTSLPAAIQTVYACGSAGSSVGGGDAAVTAVVAQNVALAESGALPPGDWKTQPTPPDQPNMPNAATVAFRPIGTIGSVEGDTTALPKTGEPFPTLPVGLALLAASAAWAVLRERRRAA